MSVLMPQAGGPDHVAAASSALGRATGRWASRLATATALYHLGQQGLQLYRNYNARRAFTITVEQHDEVYDRVQEWLLDELPDDRQRALTARTYVTSGGMLQRPLQGGEAVLVSDDSQPVGRQIVLSYDGARTHTVGIGGHPVEVRIEEDANSQEPGKTPDGRSSYLMRPRRIVFTAADVDGRRAVVDLLQSIADSLVSGRRPPRVVMASRWGHWGQRRSLSVRTLDSVVLPEGHLDDIMDDLRRFLASEDTYERLGIPWHRGYLLHGPPGTGKTSTFRAIAGTLGLDIYVVSLSDLEGDANLYELVAAVPERAMLLLEDIDIVHAAKTRDDSERKGITLAGLLNATDGIVTPPGLILAMTTNDRGAIDDALLRNGRVDKELEMTYLTPEQFGALVEQLTGERCQLWADFDSDLGAGVPWPKVTAAEVVGVVIEHLDDLPAAKPAALALLDEIAQRTFGKTPANA